MQTADPLLDTLSGEREQSTQPANSSLPTLTRGELLIFSEHPSLLRDRWKTETSKTSCLYSRSPLWDGVCVGMCAHAYVRGVCWDGVYTHVCEGV